MIAILTHHFCIYKQMDIISFSTNHYQVIHLRVIINICQYRHHHLHHHTTATITTSSFYFSSGYNSLIKMSQAQISIPTPPPATKSSTSTSNHSSPNRPLLHQGNLVTTPPLPTITLISIQHSF